MASIKPFKDGDRNVKSGERQNNGSNLKMVPALLNEISMNQREKTRRKKVKAIPKVQLDGDSEVIMMNDGLVINKAKEEEEEENIANNGGGNGIKASVQNLQQYNPQDPDKVWNWIKSEQIFQEPIYSETAVRSQDYTRIVCISDTHSKHRRIHLPPGDVLIHGGDLTSHGNPSAISDLSKYFQEHSVFNEIICIAGNHDVTLHSEYYKKNWKRYHRFQGPFDCAAAEASLKKNCIYLRDSEYNKIHNNGVLRFYGSPWSPFFCDWAFNLDRGAPIQEVWRNIPSSTDVLITHGPPLGRGDLTLTNMRVGCFDLLVEIQDRIIPRVHVFGHVHEGAGVTFDGHTLYVNASNLDITYQAKNYPIVIDIPHDKSKPAQIVPPDCEIMNPQDLSNWCKDKEYHSLGDLFIEKADNLNNFSYGNNLFDPTACAEIANQLNITLDRDAQHMLRQALSKLYAESFPGK